MPYVGRDWDDVSTGSDTVLAIDLGPYLDPSDSLVPLSLTSDLVLLAGAGPAPSLADAPYLVGTIANQKINLPPIGQYSMRFTCRTQEGAIIELWSHFWSRSPP